MPTKSARSRIVMGLIALCVATNVPLIAQDSALCELPSSDQGALVSQAGLRAIAYLCGEAPEFSTSNETPSIPTPFYGAVDSNVQVNATPDAVATAPATTQSEPSMASLGNVIVAGWNDSSHLIDSSFNGYGVSTDGGQTWTDRGGLLPVAGFSVLNAGDPWLRVHHRTGNFYYAMVAVPDLNVFNTHIILYTGAAWCYVCPWQAIAEWAEGVRLWGRRKEGLSLGLKWPKPFRNVWPAIVLFAALTWIELGFGVIDGFRTLDRRRSTLS